VIKVDSRLVVVPVSVTNANGDPVLGLTAKDFAIEEEGRKQTIENAGDALSSKAPGTMVVQCFLVIIAPFGLAGRCPH